MIIDKVISNIHTDNPEKWIGYSLDYLDLDWYELNKRILRKRTVFDQEISIRLEGRAKPLADGDILYDWANTLIVVRVKEIECMAVIATNSLELARMCYEIGNHHAPLFIDKQDDRRLLLPKDKPLQLMLEKIGLKPIIVKAKLTNPLSYVKNHYHDHE